MVMLMPELDNPRSKKLYNLTEMRIDAGFYNIQSLADAAGLSVSETWKAGSHREISRVTATKILYALRERGYNVTITDIDWVIKPTVSKPRGPYKKK